MDPQKRAADLDSEENSQDALSMEQINELLAKEDPMFVEGLKDLGDIKAPEGVKLEPLGIEMDEIEADEETPVIQKRENRLLKFLTWPARTVRNFNSRRLLKKVTVLTHRSRRALLQGFRSHLKWWSIKFLKLKRWSRNLTPTAKNTLWLMFFCLMAMAGAAASLGKFDVRSLLQGVELKDLTTVADQVYHFDENTPRESFFSPLRRPEAYILIDSMVIQLKPSRINRMPKLYVEYIVEASSQRAALEIQQKTGILRDQLARAGENFTLDELKTLPGKDRLKSAVQKQINENLESGYVRNVYFKKFLTM